MGAGKGDIFSPVLVIFLLFDQKQDLKNAFFIEQPFLKHQAVNTSDYWV